MLSDEDRSRVLQEGERRTRLEARRPRGAAHILRTVARIRSLSTCPCVLHPWMPPTLNQNHICPEHDRKLFLVLS